MEEEVLIWGSDIWAENEVAHANYKVSKFKTVVENLKKDITLIKRVSEKRSSLRRLKKQVAI